MRSSRRRCLAVRRVAVGVTLTGVDDDYLGALGHRLPRGLVLDLPAPDVRGRVDALVPADHDQPAGLQRVQSMPHLARGASGPRGELGDRERPHFRAVARRLLQRGQDGTLEESESAPHAPNRTALE